MKYLPCLALVLSVLFVPCRAATAVVARAVMQDTNGVARLGTNTLAISGGMLYINGIAFSGGSGGGSAMPTQTISVATPGGGTTGIVFTGTFAPLPNAPATPTPSDVATGIAQPVTVSWTDTGTGYGIATAFDLLTNGSTAATAQTATSLLLPTLPDSSSLSWQVIAHNASGATTGSVWTFTTAARSPPPPTGTNIVYISGAGDAEYNGTYVWVDSYYSPIMGSPQPIYTNTANPSLVIGYHPSFGCWDITGGTEMDAYISSDLLSWTVISGDAPAPSGNFGSE